MPSHVLRWVNMEVILGLDGVKRADAQGFLGMAGFNVSNAAHIHDRPCTSYTADADAL